MINKLLPEADKAYLIQQYSLFHILEGSGGIEVDFRRYHNWDDKLIFLEKGQYIKFLSPDFVVRQVEFADQLVFGHKDVRVLFKHLVQLGYINFAECEACKKYLGSTVFSSHVKEIIDISSKQWYWQNPFHAEVEEYHVIFDVKEIIDKKYKHYLSNTELSSLINNSGDYNAQALIKNKVGLSIKSLYNNKKLLESKKEIVFSDKNINEIAYDFGFKDAAYFNRKFKKETGKSPVEFREEFNFEERDLFLQDLYELLQRHHSSERTVGFYAQEMHLSVKALSRKVKEKLQTSLGQLIRGQLIRTAKKQLSEGVPVKEIAFQLGFEEANHFSTFFKHHTGIIPTDYKIKKYHQ